MAVDTEEWVVVIFTCLTSDNARSLFLATVIAGLQEEMGTGELSGEEMSCLRAWVAELDVVALATADRLGEDDAALEGVMWGVVGCVPDLFLAAMLAGMDVDAAELSEDELSCLRQWLSDMDLATLAASDDDAAGFDAFESVLFDLFNCVPDLFLSPGPQAGRPDDHADSAEGATVVTVGEPVHGALDHSGDVDFFVFEAEGGELYRVEVTLGSLEDSVVVLYDADGSKLAFNDDRDEVSLASLISWLAPESGSYFVQVAGVDASSTGSYTLSVAEAGTALLDEAAASFGDGSLGVVRVEAGDAIQIRSLNAITGDVAFFGLPIERSVVLAIEDYGQIKGFDVDLGTTLDDLCHYEGGQAAAQTIVADERVIGVVGTSCSGAALAAAPLITSAGMAMISGGNTSPTLTSDLAGNAGPNYSVGYYRTSPNDLFQSVAMAKFVFGELGIETAAAIHDGDPYTQALVQVFADAFELEGGTVTGIGAVNRDGIDMVPALTEIAAGSPGALFFPIFQPAGDFIADQAPAVSGLENTVLLAADGLLTNNFLALPQAAGMYFSGPDTRFGDNVNQSTARTANDVLAAYEERYGVPPPLPFWAHGYDATMLLLDAIDAASYVDGDTLVVDRQGVRDFLDSVGGYSGLTGTINCDNFGDCGAARITIVENIGGEAYVEASMDNVVFSFSPLGSATAE